MSTPHSKENTATITALPKELELFQGCSPSFIKQLKQSASRSHHDKGHLIFVSDDEAHSLYIVISGWVKLFRETLDGTEAVIDVLNDNHFFGEHALFNNGIHEYSAETADKTVLLSIPLNLLKRELQQNPDLSFNFLKALAQKQHIKEREIEQRSIQSTAQRIGCFLLRLTKQDGKKSAQIHLPYDKTLIAARLGMQPETFSRALSKLKQSTNIEVRGATVNIEDVEKLVNYTCSMCSHSFPCEDLEKDKA